LFLWFGSSGGGVAMLARAGGRQGLHLLGGCLSGWNLSDNLAVTWCHFGHTIISKFES
jgi:hypothetical protein